MDFHHVFISPVVTEKSTQAQTHKKYTIIVHADANKIDITKAIQEAYGVEVKHVRIIQIPTKVRLVGRGRVMTKRPARKKAIITLEGKGSIDFNKMKTSK